MGLTTSLPMKVKIYRMRKRLVMPNKAIRTEWQIETVELHEGDRLEIET